MRTEWYANLDINEFSDSWCIGYIEYMNIYGIEIFMMGISCGCLIH